jgi:hypothetical protein
MILFSDSEGAVVFVVVALSLGKLWNPSYVCFVWSSCPCLCGRCACEDGGDFSAHAILRNSASIHVSSNTKPQMQLCNVDIRLVLFIPSLLFYRPFYAECDCCHLVLHLQLRYTIVPSCPWCIHTSSYEYVLVTAVMPYVSAQSYNSPFISKKN